MMKAFHLLGLSKHSSFRNFSSISANFPVRRNPMFQIRAQQVVSKRLASKNPTSTQSEIVRREMREVDTSFNNSKEAFLSKTTLEVLRAYVVFSLLRITYLAENQMKIMKMAQKVMGNKLFAAFMRATFYGHFVAGVDQEDIAPKISRLRRYGVKAILDYSAEEDVSEVPSNQMELMSTPETSENERLRRYKEAPGYTQRKLKALGRTYYYKSEHECYKNMDIFLKSIEAVSKTTDSTGFAAIKMTALAKPQLLVRISEAIEKVHEFVEYLTGVHAAAHNKPIKPSVIKEKFANAAKEFPEVQTWLNEIEADSKGIINFLPWKELIMAKKSVFEAMQIPNIHSGKLESIITPFTYEETKAFENALYRLHTIFQLACDLNIRVMVDAEQTYLQPAISRITVECMRIYNKEKPVVFNTYQCYLKSALHDMILDITQAERQGFYFGAKLVRGAYMEQERQRAEMMMYEDPINDTYEDTTQMYKECFREILSRMKERKEEKKPLNMGVMAATHNEETVDFVIRKMKQYKISRYELAVCFGQLYGMCDHISFPLGQSGYSVYKYVPYGPVLEVLPYLGRRAQENKGFLKKTAKDRKLLRQELFRRIKTGEIFYKPAD